ncbi:hypothetical protein SDC9_68125 [bioreactor metagenome]|uniref:Uncharacterized protein n=1 Tax=bioreactor metagenome TaxID=1076179 RepID=A0A644XZL6_9ZZZZ
MIEDFPVFRVDNSLDGGAEHAHVVFLEDLVLIQRYAAVQRRLSSKRKEDTVGTLFFDHPLHKIRGYG